VTSTVVESAERFTSRGGSHRIRNLLVLLAVLVLAGVAVWLVWFSSVLTVSQVRVLGATSVPEAQVRAAIDVPLGTPLARVDAEGIVARVGAIPAIGAVEVRRGWPNLLVVVVTERTPLAVVADGTRFAYVDATGARFGSAAARGRFPVVRASGPTALVSALGVLSSLPDADRATVVRVSARTRDDVVLQLATGSSVQWGGPQDAERKLAVLHALLPRRARLYDVSAPDLPTTQGTLPPVASSPSS